MKKPKRAISIKLIQKRTSVDKAIVADNNVLRWMEFKMRFFWNPGKYSRYILTDKERGVILHNLLKLDIVMFLNPQERILFNTILNDLESCRVPKTGYNKRALVGVIDAIRNQWAYLYPSNIIIKRR